MNMSLRATAPKGMPRPKGIEGYKLLNAVWQQFARSGRWPAFELIDRALYRDGIEFEATVQQLPAGLLLGIDPTSGVGHLSPTKRSVSPSQVQCTAMTPRQRSSPSSGLSVLQQSLSVTGNRCSTTPQHRATRISIRKGSAHIQRSTSVSSLRRRFSTVPRTLPPKNLGLRDSASGARSCTGVSLSTVASDLSQR